MKNNLVEVGQNSDPLLGGPPKLEGVKMPIVIPRNGRRVLISREHGALT